MPTHVDRRPDIEFRRTDDSRLLLDVYRPAGATEPLPAVVYFHGGGWARGSRTDYAEDRLVPVAASGIVVASASYRFSDVAGWPAQLDDAAAAVEYVLDHADHLGVDSSRVGVWGASAGGHIATMLALHRDRPAIAAAVAFHAPTDLVALQTDPVDPGARLPAFLTGRATPPVPPEARLVEASAAGERLDALHAASPVACVGQDAPPLLLVTGNRDALMPVSQPRRLTALLAAAGVEHQLLVIDGATHEDPAFHTPAVLGAVAGWISVHQY
ncbi:alpha/beta hydrolase fold domain-containing protein [Streptomyces mirabilis]